MLKRLLRLLLLSIAVVADAMGKGVGTILMKAFEDAIRRQTNQCSLSVVKSNHQAILIRS